MDKFNIAIIGATGAVGRILLQLLEERQFPANSIRVCGSEKSLGQKLIVNGKNLTVEIASSQLLGEVDIAFVAASSEISRKLTPLAAQQNTLVIDKSTAFRMDPQVPLVVPELNSDDLTNHSGIIASPNCSTIPLAMVLKYLNDINPVVRAVVSTYQSVSGTGTAAMDELSRQSVEVLDDQNSETSSYAHRIAFNVLPHVETFLKNGHSREEIKMVEETRKILHAPSLRISATCVRVPVFVGHCEAVNIEFAEDMSVDDVKSRLGQADGIRIIDDTELNEYPMPIVAEGDDSVHVGRIREDLSHPRGIVMWTAIDNLRKGAALNAIQIAEEMIRRNSLNVD